MAAENELVRETDAAKLNQRLHEFMDAVESTAVVLRGVANGDLNQKVKITYEGDKPVNYLGAIVNATVRKIADSEQNLKRALKRAEKAKADAEEAQRKAEEAQKKSEENEASLRESLKTVEQQALAIRELSTPVMEIWEDVLVLPIVGVVDTRRSMDIMNTLLQKIVESQSKCVIIDITGVEIIDTKTADYLLKIVRASNLLGTRAVLTGLSPAVAQTLVEIGAELNEVKTLRSLKDGLRECLKFLSQNRAEPRS